MVSKKPKNYNISSEDNESVNPYSDSSTEDLEEKNVNKNIISNRSKNKHLPENKYYTEDDQFANIVPLLHQSPPAQPPNTPDLLAREYFNNPMYQNEDFRQHFFQPIHTLPEGALPTSNYYTFNRELDDPIISNIDQSSNTQYVNPRGGDENNSQETNKFGNEIEQQRILNQGYYINEQDFRRSNRNNFSNQNDQIVNNLQNQNIYSTNYNANLDREYETRANNLGGKKKIKLEYIKRKPKRGVTFSKRKKGIMKKAFELSVLTGSEILLVIANETGHVYTYATRKLKPVLTRSEAFIKACLGTDIRDPFFHRDNISNEEESQDKKNDE